MAQSSDGDWFDLPMHSLNEAWPQIHSKAVPRGSCKSYSSQAEKSRAQFCPRDGAPSSWTDAEMKLKHLESALHDVDGFQCPNIALEQYMTSPHLAAVMVHTMHGLGDIEDRRVLDLGVGCGMLSVASALMGSRCVVGVDVDETALESARANVDELELNDVIDLVRGDVNTLRMRKFDTVIMNPPFGTRCKGIDMAFIRTALDLATSAVYSLHKTSTRQHILKKAREWGAEAKVLAELRFDLPQSYGFHKLQSKDIQVDFIRLVPRQR